MRHDRAAVWSEGWLFLLSVAVTAAVLAAGCGGDLPTASHLERTRVLGARLQVAADPGRADALPDEAATVEWLVTGPRAPGALGWAFAVCEAIEGMCADAPVMAASGTGLPVVAPFTAPPARTDLRRPLMLGAVCAGGAPELDASGRPGCESGAVSANVTRFEIPTVPPGETPNHHPIFGDDLFELAGAAWTAQPEGDAGGPCDPAAGLPSVVAGAPELSFRIVTNANDREAVTAAGVTALEELQLSSFVTAGELGGSYALIAATDTRPDADFVVKWTPPPVKEVPAEGVTTHFHFVVRDGRGGLDWAHRALCVSAP